MTATLLLAKQNHTQRVDAKLPVHKQRQDKEIAAEEPVVLLKNSLLKNYYCIQYRKTAGHKGSIVLYIHTVCCS